MSTAPKSPSPEERPQEGSAPAPKKAEEPKSGRREKGGRPKESPEREGSEGKSSEAKGKGKGAKGAATGPPKKGKPVPDNPDFRYIVRIAGTDLDGRRSTALALTGVRGMGLRMASVACRIAQVDPVGMIGNLPEATVDGLEATIGSLTTRLPRWMLNHPAETTTGEVHHYASGDLETARRDDVNRMRMIRSYRGVRHERGQKVRGQRTRSNGRSGMAAGVLKKAAKEAAAAKEATPAAATKPAAEKA